VLQTPAPANRERRERAAALAEQLGTTTPAVALAYVFHQPEYVLPAVGTRSEAHLDEALAAADLRLNVDQLTWLEQGPAAGVTAST
jgi:aryl-alcohol dehydrogenase-like predicted oxidoreductase